MTVRKMIPSNLSINFSVCFSQARSLINKIMFGLVAKLQHWQSRIGGVDLVFLTKKESHDEEEGCEIYA